MDSLPPWRLEKDFACPAPADECGWRKVTGLEELVPSHGHHSSGASDSLWPAPQSP